MPFSTSAAATAPGGAARNGAAPGPRRRGRRHGSSSRRIAKASTSRASKAAEKSCRRRSSGRPCSPRGGRGSSEATNVGPGFETTASAVSSFRRTNSGRSGGTRRVSDWVAAGCTSTMRSPRDPRHKRARRRQVEANGRIESAPGQRSTSSRRCARAAEPKSQDESPDSTMASFAEARKGSAYVTRPSPSASAPPRSADRSSWLRMPP